jgi:hypothetical protein
MTTKLSLHHEGNASLSGLTVDANDPLELSSNVLGVKGDIGDLPSSRTTHLKVVNTFANGVLMRA